MHAEKLVKANDRFFTEEPGAKSSWLKVFKQSIAHTRRLTENPLIDELRPNEEKAILQYRQKIKRMLTKAPIDEMLTQVTSIIDESGIDVETGKSESLKAWLNSEPFFFLGQNVGLWEYWYRCICRTGIEDPNAVIVPFPYRKENPLEPPVNTELTNEPIDILTMVIESKLIVRMPSEREKVFAWLGGHTKVNVKEMDKPQPFFYVLDEENFYVLLPVKKDEKGLYRYALQLWYPHLCTNESGEKVIPVTVMPGTLTTTEDSQAKYHESLIHGTYEFFDEFLVRFSDLQALMTKQLIPKLIVNEEINCPSCKGLGHIKIKDPKGGKAQTRKCGKCNNGKIADVSPYAQVHRKTKNLEKGSSRPLMEYVESNAGILDLAYNQTFEFLEKGMQKMGLNLLVDVNESGVAKTFRLEPKEHFLNSFTKGFFGDTMQRFLGFVECLLQIDEAKRIKPVVKLPTSFRIKNANQLIEESKESFHSLRMLSELEAIDKKYKDQPIATLMHWSYCYCPILYKTEQEVNDDIINGTITRNEKKKRDLVIIGAKEYLNEIKGQVDQATRKDFFNFLDKFLADFIQEEEPIFEGSSVEPGQASANSDPEPIEGQETTPALGQLNTKLLETVGGVGGIIQLSVAVASGQMTENAAEAVLTNIYGLPKEIASQLIEAPFIQTPNNEPTGNE